MEDKGTSHIGVLTADLFIPDAASLKEKRVVLRRLRDRVRNEFNVSAAEIAYQDKWQRSQWAFCIVGTDRIYIDAAIQKLLEFLRCGRQADLIDYHIEFL